MLLGATSMSNSSVYLAQLVFRPIQLSTDDGVYACEVSVEAELNAFVMTTEIRSNNITLLARGMMVH